MVITFHLPVDERRLMRMDSRRPGRLDTSRKEGRWPPTSECAATVDPHSVATIPTTQTSTSHITYPCVSDSLSTQTVRW